MKNVYLIFQILVNVFMEHLKTIQCHVSFVSISIVYFYYCYYSVIIATTNELWIEMIILNEWMNMLNGMIKKKNITNESYDITIIYVTYII